MTVFHLCVPVLGLCYCSCWLTALLSHPNWSEPSVYEHWMSLNECYVDMICFAVRPSPHTVTKSFDFSTSWKNVCNSWYFCNILNTLSCFSLVVTMVMKSAVEDDDAGWGLGIPEKMKNNANWVDITHEFKGACKGTGSACDCVSRETYVCGYERDWRVPLFCLSLFSSFIYAELNLGELLHDKLWVGQILFCRLSPL